MKHFASLCILLVLINFSTQVPKYVLCPEKMKIYNTCDCCEITCVSATEMMGRACPVVSLPTCPSWARPNLFQDRAKEYPDCCTRPYCGFNIFIKQ